MWEWLVSGTISGSGASTRRAGRVLAVAAVACLGLVAAPSASAAVLATGDSHGCAAAPGGTLKCWGLNDFQQLAAGSPYTASTPIAVAGLGGKATQVTGGRAHTCVVLSTASARCWGFGSYGQLGNGGTSGSASPVSVVSLDGPVAAIGSGPDADHTCAITTGGTLQCWGLNTYDQLGASTLVPTSGTPVTVFGLGSTPVQVAAGKIHTCARLATGSIRCWGANYGLLGNGTSTASSTPTPVEATGIASARDLTVGSNHSCVALESGEAKCWGSNAWGQLGDGTKDGRNAPVTVVDLPDRAVQLAAGAFHTCALIVGGTVRCWGANGLGQLGNLTNDDSSTPVGVQGLGGGAVAIAAGRNHTCALRSDGEVRCWGDGISGQLGDGSTGTLGSNVAVPVSGVNLKPSTPVITSAPAAITNLRTASVSFTQAESLTSFACSLDGAAVLPCASPVVRSALADGTRSVSVRARWSEVSSDAVSAGWLVDTVAPRLLGRTKTRTSTRTTYRLTVGSDASGVAKVEYSTATRVPSASATPVASRTLNFATPLVIGTRSTVRWLRLRDAAGNWSRWYTG